MSQLKGKATQSHALPDERSQALAGPDPSSFELKQGPQIGQAILRAAGPVDLPAILALNRARWAIRGLMGESPEALAPDLAQQAEDRAERLLHRALAGNDLMPGDPAPLLLLCEERGRLLGFGLGWCSPPPVGPGLHDQFAIITDIALVPEAQARGLGGVLVEAMLAAIRDGGCTSVRVRLTPGQDQTDAVLRDLGFAVESIEHRLRLGDKVQGVAPANARAAARVSRLMRQALPVVVVAIGAALVVLLIWSA